MIKSMLRSAVRGYRGSEFKWRFQDNLKPTLAFRGQRPELAGEAARVLRDLERDGIAITTAEKLLGPRSLYDELAAEVARLEAEQAEVIDEARKAADLPGKSKTFIHELLGKKPPLDPSSIWVRFALQNPVLQIANSYYGMFTHLRFYNVWHTMKTTTDARRSQLWHRDPEDWQILKVFVYVSDVDEGAGPFTYAPGTHPRGRVKDKAQSFKEQGHGAERSTDEDMNEVVPKEKWITATGKAGTIIFADTKGYHRGGLARERDRIMYNCMFVSPASKAAELFERNGAAAGALEKEQALALRL